MFFSNVLLSYELFYKFFKKVRYPAIGRRHLAAGLGHLYSKSVGFNAIKANKGIF
jgi:hypothetical protein